MCICIQMYNRDGASVGATVAAVTVRLHTIRLL